MNLILVTRFPTTFFCLYTVLRQSLLYYSLDQTDTCETSHRYLFAQRFASVCVFFSVHQCSFSSVIMWHLLSLVYIVICLFTECCSSVSCHSEMASSVGSFSLFSAQHWHQPHCYSVAPPLASFCPACPAASFSVVQRSSTFSIQCDPDQIGKRGELQKFSQLLSSLDTSDPRYRVWNLVFGKLSPLSTSFSGDIFRVTFLTCRYSFWRLSNLSVHNFVSLDRLLPVRNSADKILSSKTLTDICQYRRKKKSKDWHTDSILKTNWRSVVKSHWMTHIFRSKESQVVFFALSAAKTSKQSLRSDETVSINHKLPAAQFVKKKKRGFVAIDTSDGSCLLIPLTMRHNLWVKSGEVEQVFFFLSFLPTSPVRGNICLYYSVFLQVRTWH